MLAIIHKPSFNSGHILFTSCEGSWPKKSDNRRNFHYCNSRLFSWYLLPIVIERPHIFRSRYHNRDMYARNRQLYGIFHNELYMYSC